MATTGFSHYNLRAPRDLLESLRAFYCDVVGLAVGPRPPFPTFGYWLYAGGQAVLHLSETRAGEQRAVGVDTTFDHAAFECTERPAVERRLVEKGIEFRGAAVPGTARVQLFLRDPAGNGVELNFGDEAA